MFGGWLQVDRVTVISFFIGVVGRSREYGGEVVGGGVWQWEGRGKRGERKAGEGRRGACLSMHMSKKKRGEERDGEIAHPTCQYSLSAGCASLPPPAGGLH